jgi:hypothetical protein
MAQEGRGEDQGLPAAVMALYSATPPAPRRKYLSALCGLPRMSIIFLLSRGDIEALTPCGTYYHPLASPAEVPSVDDTGPARSGNPKPPPLLRIQMTTPPSPSDAPPLSATSPSY